MVCETSGSTGSDLFIEWLKTIENIDKFKAPKDYNWAGVREQEDLKYLDHVKDEYMVLESTYRVVEGGWGDKINRYIILIRKDLYPEHYQTVEPICLEPEYEEGANECIVM